MKKLAWMAALALVCGLIATPAHAQRQRPDRNRIRFEEIQQSNATTVYQLIQSKRGMWLMRGRTTTDMSGTGMGGLLVFFDGAQLDNVEDLRDVPVANVRLVEFLSPHEAEQKLGKYTTVGAIRVLTHDETPPAPGDSTRSAPPR
jgi:hypothetical protein